ncbi:MAG: hypothetical protein IIX84_05340 [Oscillospiraceae bacterium]|nr:hypothetical protein [Oscillospiraceae bacterium]
MEKIFENIPLPRSAADREYPCGNGVHMLIFSGISAEAFSAYCAELTEKGFTLTDSHSIPGSSFAFFTREGLTLALNLFGEDLRIVADGFTAPVKLADPCPRTAQTTLWQHEVDHTMIDCGMCFIIRCCDGSWFIIDSGHYFQVNDNDRIHKFMRDRTPEGERIRIAGWFISHCHSDHVSKFCDFLRYNMDDCDLEAVYLNFPHPYPPEGAAWGRRGNNLFILNVNEQLDSLPEIPVVKLHTGQRFAVRNLNFTVLCTHEDVFPTEDTDFNNTSTVLMMESEGTKVLFLGDASDASSTIMEKRWGELLKCDILQVAHHGHHGCSAALYEFTRADAALFSNTQIFFDIDLEKEKEANATILRYAKEYYISSNGTVEADLPYTAFKELPDETFEDFAKINQLWGYEYTPERKAELYAKFLERGGKDRHPFARDPNSDGWHED